VRRVAGAARRATAGLSGGTKAAVVAVTVATGTAVPLIADHAGPGAPVPTGPAAVGVIATPPPLHQKPAAKHRRKARSRGASALGEGTAPSAVAFPGSATAPEAPDSQDPPSLQPDGPGGLSRGHGDSSGPGSSGQDPTSGPGGGAPPVSGGVSLSTGLPGVATLDVNAGVSTTAPVRLPASAAAPPLPRLPKHRAQPAAGRRDARSAAR
jgi:hypothetical protein